jgi:ABC-2 type transport system ATP-binding protein
MLGETSMSVIIDVQDLTKHFGDLVAVDHTRYQVQKSEIFGLLGHNGAGKTTTINMLVGLLTPTEGTALIAGHDVTTDPLEARRSIGLLPDLPGYYDNLTAIQNLQYYADLAEVPSDIAKERIQDLLERVGLTKWGTTKVGQYSRGMKQRLGIAQALVRDPDVLIFDEPTGGLDPNGTKSIRELIKSLASEQKKTVIVSTHLLPEATQMCDRVAILKEGKLIALDTIPNLTEAVDAEEGTSLEDIFFRFYDIGVS